MGNVVKVNINSLTSYADRIDNVNRRLGQLDRELDSLWLTPDARNLALVSSADWIIGTSSSLRHCSDYLRKTASDFTAVESYLSAADPRSFQKPSYDIVTSDDWRDKVGKAVKIAVEEVSSFVSDTVESIKKKICDTWEQIVYSYQNGGFVYKAVKVGEQALNLGLGIIEVFAVAGELVGSVGALSPLAVAQLVDAGNRIMSSSANLTNMLIKGDYESDINVLKDTAGDVGQLVGGNLGRSVGEFMYYGFSITMSVKSVAETTGKVFDSYDELISSANIKSAKEFVSNAFTTVKNIANTTVNADTFTELKDITQAGIELRTAYNTGKFFYDFKDATDAATDFGKGIVTTSTEVVRTASDAVKAVHNLIIQGVRK